jgi:hypothetical protein
MVPKLDQIHIVDAPIYWRGTDIIGCSRQILWVLGDRLVARFGSCYQGLSDSLHVYALQHCLLHPRIISMGLGTMWLCSGLKLSFPQRMILDRYRWMMNELISSIEAHVLCLLLCCSAYPSCYVGLSMSPNYLLLRSCPVSVPSMGSDT